MSGEASLPFAFEQAHVLNAALSYKFGDNYTVGAVLHFNTGRPESGQITSHTQREVQDPEGRTSWGRVDGDRLQRLPPFFRVDLRAAKSWAMEDFTLDLSLDILNASVQSEVYGFDYAFSPETGAPERQAIRLPVILPMLGLKGTY
jgi:hypothetical protein